MKVNFSINECQTFRLDNVWLNFKTTQAAFFSVQQTELSLNLFFFFEHHIRLFGDMKPLSIILSVGAILGVRLLPADAKPVEISQRDIKGYLPRGM